MPITQPQFSLAGAGDAFTDPDAALNENQAAEFLGQSVRTLQAWRVRGGGPTFVKIGRSVRYRRRVLVEFLERNSVNSTTEADARKIAGAL